ncbi:hypothetical protein H6F89_34455 [Cyanobacteria bacterium FACHB-63]|nr:hypothetical protein [Cyanobacteria bacterium FACHB-63]
MPNQNPKKRVQPKALLHSLLRALVLVDGIKGGTGKSLFTKVLIEFFRDSSIEISVGECDRDSPDVARAYESLVGQGIKEVIFAYFSEDPTKRAKADPLFNHATNNIVVANLPAQSPQFAYSWLIGDRLYELANEQDITLVHFFVSNGSYASVNLFQKTLSALGPYIPYLVLVRNQGLCDDWSVLDENREIQGAIAKHKVQVIDLPRVPHRENYFLDQHQLAFYQGLKHPDLTIPERGRLNQFLQKAFEQIRKVESYDGRSSQ